VFSGLTLLLIRSVLIAKRNGSALNIICVNFNKI